MGAFCPENSYFERAKVLGLCRKAGESLEEFELRRSIESLEAATHADALDEGPVE